MRGGIPFRKKEWMTANLYPPEDAHDKRPESRKVDMSSIRILNKVDDDEVRQVVIANLRNNIASIEHNGASLGFVKPKLVDYDLNIISTSDQEEQMQITEAGIGAQNMVKLKQESSYRFECPIRKGCACGNHPHHMIILDWEVNELYRNVIARDKDPRVIKKKMRQRMFDFMKTRDLYFMVGTHHRWNVWMIVSVLYLRPSSAKTAVLESSLSD